MKTAKRKKLIEALGVFETLLVKCGGPGSGVPGPCPSGNNPHTKDDSARWALGQFTPEERQKGLSALSKIPDTDDPGYHTFDGVAGQLRTKDVGMKGIGALLPQPGDSKKPVYSLLTLDPSKVHYTQSSVIRSAVEKKLQGQFDNAETASTGSPIIVKRNGEYHLQYGHHRAVAQILATGMISARVAELDPKSKRGKAKFLPPPSE